MRKTIAVSIEPEFIDWLKERGLKVGPTFETMLLMFRSNLVDTDVFKTTYEARMETVKEANRIYMTTDNPRHKSTS